MSLFIDDGHTLHGLIAARPGRHGRFKFTYRRALPKRHYRWRNVERATGDADFDADCSLVQEHVSAIESMDGEDAVATSPPEKFKAALARMEPEDIRTMVLHVVGIAVTTWDGTEKNG